MSEARPRRANGRFVTRVCPDPNCGGSLQPEGDEWRCDGLTHDTPDGPLYACKHFHDPRWEGNQS